MVLGDVDYVYANITSAIACPPTQAQFLEVLNTGLCDQSFRGFYIVWVGQFLSTSCLFVAAVATLISRVSEFSVRASDTGVAVKVTEV